MHEKVFRCYFTNPIDGQMETRERGHANTLLSRGRIEVFCTKPVGRLRSVVGSLYGFLFRIILAVDRLTSPGLSASPTPARPAIWQFSLPPIIEVRIGSISRRR